MQARRSLDRELPFIAPMLISILSLLIVVPSWSRPLPARLPDQHPISSLHFGFAPQAASIEYGQGLRSDVLGAWANVSISDPSYVIDAETRSLYFDFAYSLREDTELSVRVPLRYRGRGVLDPLIDGWHDLWSLPQGDRNRLADDEYEIQTSDGGLDLPARGTRFANPEIGVKHLLLEQDSSFLDFALKLDLSLPSLASTYGHDALDISLAALASKQLAERWFLDAGIAWIYYSDPSTSGVHFSRNHIAGFLNAHYLICDSFSVYTALLTRSELVESLDGYPSELLYQDFGFEWAYSDRVSLAGGFRENPIGRDASTDIDFFLNLRTVW